MKIAFCTLIYRQMYDLWYTLVHTLCTFKIQKFLMRKTESVQIPHPYLFIQNFYKFIIGEEIAFCTLIYVYG